MLDDHTRHSTHFVHGKTEVEAEHSHSSPVTPHAHFTRTKIIPTSNSPAGALNCRPAGTWEKCANPASSRVINTSGRKFSCRYESVHCVKNCSVPGLKNNPFGNQATTFGRLASISFA